MKLDDIIKEILDIAKDMENSVMFSNSLDAQKKRTAANLLLSTITPLCPNVAKDCTPSKSRIKSALNSLEDIDRTYHIKELKQPIKELKAYLKKLG